MLEGQYSAIFFEADPKTGALGNAFSSGVIEFRDGNIFGGDSGYYYLGTYEMDGVKFEATVEVAPHRAQSLHGSAFGVRGCTLSIRGHVNAVSVLAGGNIRSSGEPFQIRLTRIVG
jgi:hypothetical protein